MWFFLMCSPSYCRRNFLFISLFPGCLFLLLFRYTSGKCWLLHFSTSSHHDLQDAILLRNSLPFTFVEVEQRALLSHEEPLCCSLSHSLQWCWPSSSWLFYTLGQWYQAWPKCDLVKVVVNTNFRFRIDLRWERPLSWVHILNSFTWPYSDCMSSLGALQHGTLMSSSKT